MAINSIASTESDTIHLFRMKFSALLSNTFTLVFIIINMARRQQVGDCVVVNIHACTDDFCKVNKNCNVTMGVNMLKKFHRITGRRQDVKSSIKNVRLKIEHIMD